MENVKNQIKLLSNKSVKVVKVNNIHDFLFYLTQAHSMNHKYYLFEKNRKNEGIVDFQGQKYYVLYDDNFCVFSTFTKSIIQIFKTNFNNSCCVCEVVSIELKDDDFMMSCNTCNASICESCFKKSFEHSKILTCPICRSKLDAIITTT